MTRLLVGMLRRARRLLAEANARGGGEGGAQVGGGVAAAGGPSVASASDAAHALLRAVQAVQRQHAALALFAASRQPLSFASPAARALLLKHSQHYGDGTEHGVGAEGGRVPSPGVSTATWAFWAQGGYPARLLDPSLVEALCPAPLTEPTATPSPVQASTKRTYQPSLLIRKRRHGFLARVGTATGRRVLLNRRIKSRRKLSA